MSKEVPAGGPLSGDSGRLSGEIRESEGNQPPTFAEMMAVIERRSRDERHADSPAVVG